LGAELSFWVGWAGGTWVPTWADFGSWLGLGLTR